MTQTAQQKNALLHYRKENDLTQEQFAELLSINQGAYCKIEKGHREPSFDLAKRISQITNIPIGDLWERYKI